MTQHDDEEELRVGSERVPKRLARPAMVVFVAVAGLAAAFVSTRLGGSAMSARPSSTPSASIASIAGTSTPTLGETSAVPSSVIVLTPGSPAVPACPPRQRCRTVSASPAATIAAFRDSYAGAQVVSTRTVTTTGPTAALVSRTIRAVAGQRRLDITITPFVLGPDTFDRQNIGRVSIVTVKSTGSGATVSVLLTEPRSARADDLTVLRLARDPRLIALR